MVVTGEHETARIEAALAALALKDQVRTGWRQHGVTAPESVAAHSWGTAYLCMLFAEDAGVDLGKTLQIAVLHDLAEAITGDVAARLDPNDRQLSETEKSELEKSAIQRLLAGDLGRFADLWLEYEHRSTPEAVFVREMNLLDMCLQGLKYEQERRYDPGVLIASSGGHRHLDEFFLGARARISSPLATRLFDHVHALYLEARAAHRHTAPAGSGGGT